MKPTTPLKALAASAFLGFLSGCAHYHLEAGAGQDQVNDPLPATSGVSTAQAQAAAQKTIFNLSDVYALAVSSHGVPGRDRRGFLEQAEAQQARKRLRRLASPQVGLLCAEKPGFPGIECSIRPGHRAATPKPADRFYLSGAETIPVGPQSSGPALQGARRANIDAERLALRAPTPPAACPCSVAQSFLLRASIARSPCRPIWIPRDLTQKILDVQKKWVGIGRAQKS